MKLPIISIIIPTFNSAKTLAIALESVIQQSYEHKEIIVVDGNSSDETINIVSNYAQLYPYISWVSEKDNGIYDAMNKGIKLAKGDWLYFLGSDDRLFHHTTLANVFIEDNYFNYDFLYGNVKWKVKNEVHNTYTTIDTITRANINHQTIFYHKKIFEKYTYNTAYRICADWYLNMQCFLDSDVRIKHIEVIIAEYNEYGISQNYKEDVNFFKAAKKLTYEHFIHKVNPTSKYQLYEDLVISGIDNIVNHKNTLQGIQDVLKGGAANKHLLKSIKDILYWLWKRLL